MDTLIPILFVLFFLLVLVTLVGHGIWVILAWLFREVGGSKPRPDSNPLSISQPSAVSRSCHNCGYGLIVQMSFCGVCGARRLSLSQQELIRELEITARHVERLRQIGALDEVNWRILKTKIDTERDLILFPQGRPGTARQQSLFTPVARPQAPPPKPTTTTPDESQPFATPAVEGARVTEPGAPDPGAWTKDSDQAQTVPPILKPPRRPFAEVLAAFMEERNVRWGEIIGGILIIGCSTALVISLWAQISRVPLIKFLIFTTVTAALFGVGFYTAHRWKLPTTSRGILTIATLLVPLNFLAIAAVSSGGSPAGVLLVFTELFAPAFFLCFVYFAGRIITPRWPHLLAAGALGSSIGQLLVRHLGGPANSPVLIIALGAFPVMCYLVATSWSLKIALADDEVDEPEANAIFITLGALTFAASLPIGLLLFKTGSPPTAVMHLAPVVTLAAGPMLGTGLLLWKRVSPKRLPLTRTIGGGIAILGGLLALAGIVLGWPNPASIVPAAVLNFLLFTAIAVYLGEPRAHVIGALCITLAYLAAFHVLAGHVAWQNPVINSLVPIMGSASTGQALALPFVSFVLVYEWFRRVQKPRDAFSYLLAAGAMSLVSLALLFIFGVGHAGDPDHVSLISGLYAAGAFWLAWRERSVVLSWSGVALLFVTSAQVCHSLASVRFPWQASLIFFALICTAGALLARQFGQKEIDDLVIAPLRRAAIAGTAAAGALLLGHTGWRGFEPPRLLAIHTLILAAVLLGLLVLSHARVFFTGFQIALTLAAILLTKSYLQSSAWYAYQTDAWLHPWALQAQGVVLAFMCLMWVVFRLLLRRRAAVSDEKETGWVSRILIDSPLGFDHVLAGLLVIGLLSLVFVGAVNGINRELTSASQTPLVFNPGGFPYQLIFGLGSFAVLATLLAVMLANVRERGHFAFAIGGMTVLWALCPLVAGRFDSQFAMASATRWSVTIFLLVISIAYAIRGKPTLLESRSSFATIRFVILSLTLGPLLLLTSASVISYVNYASHGPQGGVFRAMGGVALYGAPLVFAAVALGLHGVRERSPAFVFSAGLLVNLTVTTVLVVAVAEVNGAMNRVVLVNALQLNAIAAASVALVWMASRPWWAPAVDSPSKTELVLITCQKWIAVGFVALFIVPLGLHLIVAPYRVRAATFAAGNLNGWLALLLTMAVVLAFDKVFRKPLGVVWLAGSLLAVGSLGAFGIARFGVSRWAGLHVLLGALVLIAWLLLLIKDLPALFHNRDRGIARLWTRLELCLTDDWPWDSLLWSSIAGALAVLVALRGPFIDPLGAWWSIGSLLAVSALAAALHWNSFKRAYLYAAGILVNLSVSIWLIKYHSQDVRNLQAFVEVNVIALALAGILWLVLELRARRSQAQAKSGADGTHASGMLHAGGVRTAAASFHNVAAIASLFALSAVLAVRLYDDFSGWSQTLSPALDWFALGSLAALMVACLWDREAKYAVAGIYLTGLMVSATALHNLSLPPRRLAWGLMMAAAIQGLLAAFLWRARGRVVALMSRLKVPPRLDPKDTQLTWLGVFNILIVTTMVGTALWIVLTFFEWPLRTTAAIAIAAQALTFGLMAEGTNRRRWQRAAILVFLMGAVLFGWSFLTPHANGTWLNRAVMLMALMFGTVALVGIGLEKLIEREPDWSKAVRDCVPAITAAGVLALAFVLCAEVYYQIQFGVVRVSYPALITVAVTLIAGATVCIIFAVSPTHDPLGLSERRRTVYVYVAEALMVLLFMHIRLTMPWLFRGFFQRYWPVIVLLIAYAGVAVSELLKRRQIHVLARPIERTGAFLPLLPVLGFWIVQSQVEYSTVLFVVGGLYGLLSILRRSFWFGMAAALAGNGGLWYLLNDTAEFRLYQHPQLWLIPAAISVLIAAHLNRRNFSEAQMTGIRYLCLITIYVSSTADIFINGIAQSPWLPLVLAGLSIAGVFVGIIFRIRAFLFIGSIFLLLSIATMINFASVNFHWTWLWYVAGIATGAVIIATFAVFEKKRNEVLRVVDELKDWKR